MSGVMLNFKGKMYKLCETKNMDRKAIANAKPAKAKAKAKPAKAKPAAAPPKKPKAPRKDKGKTHAKPKSAPPKSKPKAKPAAAPPKPKTKAKKAKKKIMVEGFPAFKGDEPKAKEEKRRENNLY